MSQDSFEARRALRAAQRQYVPQLLYLVLVTAESLHTSLFVCRDGGSDDEGEEFEGDAQEQMQGGALLRPGEEAVHEDGIQPNDAQQASAKRSRPKLTYEMLTVRCPL